MRGGRRGKRTSRLSAFNGRPSKLLIALHQSSIRKPDIGRESRLLPTPPAFDAHLMGSSSEYCYAVWYEKTRVVHRLRDGENILKISLFVSSEYTNVTNGHRTTAYTALIHGVARQKRLQLSLRNCSA